VNKRKENLLKVRRDRIRSKKRTPTIKPVASELPVNAHQVRARKSNPTTPVTLSAKKLKRTRKLAWIAAKLLESGDDHKMLE
jgi:hypothetical protein